MKDFQLITKKNLKMHLKEFKFRHSILARGKIFFNHTKHAKN